MHILFLADSVCGDLSGGAQVAAWALAEGLEERGHDITFLVPRQTEIPPDDEMRGRIRIVRYIGAGQGGKFIRQGRDACKKLCAVTRFDLVHTHFAYAAVGPLQAIPKSIPRIRTFHGPWDQEGWLEECRTSNLCSLLKAAIKRKIRRHFETINLVSSLKVLTLSNCFANMAREDYKVKPERIHIIPGGADLNRFCLTDSKNSIRQRLGLPQDRRIILTVRRLAPRMGLDNLIESMTSVVDRNRDILLLVGGKGPEQDRLNTAIKSLGLEAHVRLVGFIPDVDLAAYYQASDLFVLPTLALEGFGLVVTEALACGIPVIGTPIAAIPEILRDLDPGLIAAGTDSSSLADTINAFLEGSRTKKLTPQFLRKYVEDRYGWNRHIDAVECIYKELYHNSSR